MLDERVSEAIRAINAGDVAVRAEAGEALDAICAAIDGSAELRALWDCGEWSDEACESAERRRRARG